MAKNQAIHGIQEKPTRFEIAEAGRADLTEPRAKFIFDASDKTSAIDHYEIQIDPVRNSPPQGPSGAQSAGVISNGVDNNDLQTWQDDGSHRYETPVLEPGKYILIAKAVDKAGNSLAKSAEFIIEPLEAPTITEWPRELQSGEQLIVKGTSKYLNAQIVVWLQKEGKDAKSQSARSDSKGNFVFVADEKLSDGAYKLWATVVDERDAQSKPSRPAFLKLGSWAVSLLAVVVPLVALIFILLFIIWYGWHKFVSTNTYAFILFLPNDKELFPSSSPPAVEQKGMVGGKEFLPDCLPAEGGLGLGVGAVPLSCSVKRSKAKHFSIPFRRKRVARQN